MVLHLIGDYIKLGQALKAANLVEMGSDAKTVIQNGEVFVNGEQEMRRGRKLVVGDVVEYDGSTVEIVK